MLIAAHQAKAIPVEQESKTARVEWPPIMNVPSRQVARPCYASSIPPHPSGLGDPDFMRAHAGFLMLFVGWAASTNAAISQAEQRIVAAPDESRALLDTGLTLTFEAVVEDSRCPVGGTCVWEGDAVVRIRIDGAGVKPSIYTLHTNERATREVAHGDVRIRLVSLTPLPTAEGPPRPADYRATLAARREKR
jgi:hypothetical protein